jgi:succinate-semialdehyde dehydrogenase / glutarate-semialdehyde dehydrogenase
VGKQLAAIAGAHMKRVTMKLGGYAPTIVFDDVDVDASSRLPAGTQYRNAGQVCVSPTRVLVRERVYDQFVTGFQRHSQSVKVGDGLEAGTTMGPMANPRRITAMETFIGDATQRGATVEAGGRRIGNNSNFFEPAQLTDVPKDARVMNEETLRPLAVISPFSTFEEVVTEADRLPYSLASYDDTRSAKTVNAIAAAIITALRWRKCRSAVRRIRVTARRGHWKRSRTT